MAICPICGKHEVVTQTSPDGKVQNICMDVMVKHQSDNPFDLGPEPFHVHDVRLDR